jgi:iron complex outermembrane receptor protein
VANENDEAIEFASVFLENTSLGAVTDTDGRFQIDNIPAGEYSLKCTFLGFEPVIVKIDNLSKNQYIDIKLKGDIYQIDKIEIIANRVNQDDAFTFTNVEKEQLEKWNNGQDMPYLLRFTPSMVVTSDAGNGVGYTGVRLRGSDATRVNVTINGIPLNDAESQGVFWVNLPDFGSSVENIQIQRGVGTSTTGVGSFGGTVSLNTKSTRLNPYASIATGYGSFDTRKFNIKLGSGLIADKYSIDVRYSAINSEGYVDRASADLNSLFFGASRIGENSSTRLQIFSGGEVTYQAWYGVPEAKIEGNTSNLLAHYYNNLGSIYNTPADSINLFNSDRRYNYYRYDNQVDDYGQTHFQLHDHRKLSKNLVLNTALNFTNGSGFFEEYKVDENFSDYGINEEGSADLVRRRWLDNIFYGGNLNLHYDNLENWNWSFGISAFQYDGDHFGRVINIPELSDFTPGEEYYFNVGKKFDLSAFLKSNYRISSDISIFSDFQIRQVNYSVLGDDNDGQDLDIKADFTFLNPKIGVSYIINKNSSSYASFAVANKEPNRSDFVDHPFSSRPNPERLSDLEIGYQYTKPNLFGEIVFYNMAYQDQLVLTGALNDVGSSLRTNVPESYRRGIEVNINSQLKNWHLGFSGTFSRNKIRSFDEVLYDYTDGFEEIVINHQDVDIAFSPNQIITAMLGMDVSSALQINIMNQYVSDQYLDNTSNENRKMKSYLRGDLLIEYNPQLSLFKNISIKGEIRNLWNSRYVSNGYTYSYIFGDLITENFYYPQAERNFMLSMIMEFGK